VGLLWRGGALRSSALAHSLEFRSLISKVGVAAGEHWAMAARWASICSLWIPARVPAQAEPGEAIEDVGGEFRLGSVPCQVSSIRSRERTP